MSRPKTAKIRDGGRNRQFFHALTPLANGINAIIDSVPLVSGKSGDGADRVDAAKAKRERRAAKRLKEKEK